MALVVDISSFASQMREYKTFYNIIFFVHSLKPSSLIHFRYLNFKLHYHNFYTVILDSSCFGYANTIYMRQFACIKKVCQIFTYFKNIQQKKKQTVFYIMLIPLVYISPLLSPLFQNSWSSRRYCKQSNDTSKDEQQQRTGKR